MKEKFDAIFDITEYNKAIEKVIKLRKQEAEQLKLKSGFDILFCYIFEFLYFYVFMFLCFFYFLDADLRHLMHLKDEMESKCLAIKGEQKKYADLEQECNQLDINMQPIETRLAEIRTVEIEINKQLAEQIELETS